MADMGGYFEQGELWGQPPEPYQLQVRQDILALLADRGMSVLDVGCGDGFITNALPKSMRVTGVDTSAEALKHVKVKAVQASATALPFEDGSFDLVMCNDVLEHLSAEDFPKALAELRRVARKWILVTSPCMENLPSGLTRCGACGEIYHVNHHERAFGVKEIRSLLAGLAPSVIVFSGATTSPEEIAQRRLRAGLKLLTQWDLAVCPRCGQRASTGSPERSLATVAAAATQLAQVMSARQVDRTELIALFSVAGEPLAKVPPGGSFWLHARQDGIDFLCSSPNVGPGGKGVAPAWFNSVDLAGMSSDEQADMPSQADAVALLLGGMLSQASAAENELANLRAKNESLLVRQGRMDKIEVDLQNLRAENDSLRLAAGRNGRIEVDLQNLRQENDALKLRLGQFEQVQVDLQNLRRENDELKLGAGRREQLEIEIQNLRAQNDAMRLSAMSGDGSPVKKAKTP